MILWVKAACLDWLVDILTHFTCMIWGYSSFMNERSPPRPIRLGVVQGRDCVLYDEGCVVLPVGWCADAWSHAGMWDPGFCYWYGDMEGEADEACLSGRCDVAVIVLSLYTWLLIEYSCVNLRIAGVSARVLMLLRAEVSFWERVWGRWEDAVRFGPWDIV